MQNLSDIDLSDNDRQRLDKCVGGLTVQDPWAQATIHGPKRIENRSKRPPDKVVGEWVAIHCGKSHDDDAWSACLAGHDDPWDDYGPQPITTDLDREECQGVIRDRHHPGHIIGVVEVVGYATTKQGMESYREMDEYRDIADPVHHDPWWQDSTDIGWLFDNPQPLDTPVPARGQLGVWGLEGQIAKEVA